MIPNSGHWAYKADHERGGWWLIGVRRNGIFDVRGRIFGMTLADDITRFLNHELEEDEIEALRKALDSAGETIEEFGAAVEPS